MKQIKRLFRELRFELFKIILFNSFLNAVIIFIGIYFIISFFQGSVFIAAVPALCYFIAGTLYDMKHIRLKTIEDHNVQIKEILRTARDNVNEKNVILFALFDELINKIKSVSTGSLLDFKSVIGKVLIIATLSTFVLITSPYSIDVKKIDLPFGGFDIFVGGERFDAGKEIEDVDFSDDSGLYGKKSVAILGTDTLDLQLGGGETIFNEEKANRDARNYDFPVDAYAASESFSDEKQPKEMQLAKEYNLKILGLK
ncbi:hypothetical protein CMO92_02370 [Candidatus Woesearchaeota archaeon]|nr:hypothetical protein [Candidatus Woesearchaeota archaeon]